jgi:sugar/nucleoside kinase (ribokinase family)
MNHADGGLRDVVGIGNAIVDVLTRADDSLLDDLGLAKGSMTLINADQAGSMYGSMGPSVERSGGSVGNTMAGIAGLGGTGSYIGKLHDDDFGAVFRHDLSTLGIEMDGQLATEGPPTARCLIVVTPDGQRSMATHLGACVELGPDDIDPAVIQRHQVTYLEGYLWDLPRAKEAMVRAARYAQAAGRQVALTLSDPFCVERHRESFVELIRDHVDVLFANEQEIVSLYEADGFDAALQEVRHNAGIAALTRSEKGSVIVASDEVHIVDAIPIDEVVDTTGAGDLFAAGFLFGLTHGHDLATSGRIGSIAAAEIIGHIGARPDVDLRTLVEEAI